MSEMTNESRVPQFDEADRLGKALQWAGIGVQEMADELEVSRNTIGNYLNRRRKVPRAVKIAWALRTGVPLAWIETGEAETPGPDGPGGGKRARRDSNPKPSDSEPDPAQEVAAEVAEVVVLPQRDQPADEPAAA